MIRRSGWLKIVLLALLSAGCQKKEPPESAPALSRMPPIPTHAQDKLRTMKLWLGGEEMECEMALTESQRETGMMFRTNLDEDAGMLFVFPRPFQASFWMKNTIVPLSAAYIDPAGNIAEIRDLKPQDTNSVVASSPNIQYVLEANKDWFAKHHIDVGTVVRTEYGSLQQTFVARSLVP